MASMLFFFSSRRRHTRLVSDWSSDVCSSDLLELYEVLAAANLRTLRIGQLEAQIDQRRDDRSTVRSEERRVGKEWRTRGSTDTVKKNRQICEQNADGRQGHRTSMERDDSAST